VEETQFTGALRWLNIAATMRLEEKRDGEHAQVEVNQIARHSKGLLRAMQRLSEIDGNGGVDGWASRNSAPRRP
jgi:hypothetical protein